MTNKQIIEMLKAELTCIIKSTTIDDDAHCGEICDNCEYAYAQGTYGEREEMLQSVIRQLERPKGKWVEDINDALCHKCSNCNEMYLFNVDLEIAQYNFCPNCGAEMEGVAKNATTTEEGETFGDI